MNAVRFHSMQLSICLLQALASTAAAQDPARDYQPSRCG
jgi:hypothetical protein